MLLQIKNKGILIILSIIAFYAVFTIFFEFKKTISNLQNLDFFYLPIILAMILFSIFILSIRQLYFLRCISLRITVKDSFLIFLSGLTMLITPGGGGEAIKSHYLKRKHGSAYSKTIPIVLIERFQDLLAVIAIIGMFLFVKDMPEAKIAVMFFSSIAIIAFIVIRKKTLFNLFIKLISKIKRLHKFETDLLHSRDTILTITENKPMVVGFALSIIAWIFQSLAIYFCFLALHVSFNGFEAVSLSFSSLLLGMITFVPGGVGLTEISMAGLFIKYGVVATTVPSLVLLIRLTTVWFSTAVGFISTHIVYSRNDYSSIETN